MRKLSCQHFGKHSYEARRTTRTDKRQIFVSTRVAVVFLHMCSCVSAAMRTSPQQIILAKKNCMYNVRLYAWVIRTSPRSLRYFRLFHATALNTFDLIATSELLATSGGNSSVFPSVKKRKVVNGPTRLSYTC